VPSTSAESRLEARTRRKHPTVRRSLGNSNGDPDEHNDNVKALALTAIILESPHAVLLLVPVGASGTVHSSSTDMGFAVSGSGFGAGRNVRLFSLDLGATARLVQGGRRDEVLHDGAVACELE
jgi:hypothetical protein